MKDNCHFRFSVFTATKNRANLLYQLYEELKAQSYKNFEWVIVNDGSTDNTDSVVKSFIDDGILNIQYINKPSGGKHTAWRTATPLFRGRYIVTADDDDSITSDMLAIFDKHWTELELSQDYDKFWEVRTRCKDSNGELVGRTLPSPIFDSDYNYVSYKLKLFCEMVGCRKVEVLRNEAAVPEQFHFMKDASNFDEQIRWSRAARKYKTRFVSDITRIYNSTPGSLSNNILNRCLNGEKRIISNKIVELYYTLLERRDLLLRYDKKRYIKVLFGYSLLIELYKPEDLTQLFDGLSFSQKICLHCLMPFSKLFVKYKNL